ncbi:MAG: M23 family metallopeptidase [Candidatus Chromulinivorax sp.]
MKKKWLLMILISVVHVLYIRSEDDRCPEDKSIQVQQAKKIDAKSQALLTKIIKDKIMISWPVQVCQCWISSLFGPRKSGFHNGVDFAANKGTPVYAVADGLVEIAQMSDDIKGYGNMILLQHEQLKFKDEFGHQQLYKSRYAHLDQLFVQQGNKVQKGEQIGTVGASGHVVAKNSKSDPSHLHFEIYRGLTRINPLLVLFAADKNWVQTNLA